MSAAPSRPNWLLRIFVPLLLIGAAVWGALYLMRDVAIVTAATRGTAIRTVPGTVEVKAEFANELKSEVGGRVARSSLDVGARVFKGDVLVQLDTGDVDLEIERINNEIVAARRKVEVGSLLRAEELNLTDTVANLERQAKAGGFAQAELEKMQRTLQQLTSRRELDEVNLKLSLETFENTLKVKEREKSKMTIVAPADGVVTSVLARVGDLIGGNSTIATIMATGRTIEAKLSEENFAVVKVGQKATVRFLTFGADQYNAVVSKILPSADATTQRYQVYLDVTLPEGRTLAPGLTGEVQVIIAQRPDAVLIPRRALVGDQVFLLNGSKLEARKVEKGYEGLREVEITKGLQVGDQIVLEQQDKFRDGDRVRARVVAVE